MLPRHRRSVALIIAGTLTLAGALALRAAVGARSLAGVILMLAFSAVLLVCGFAESPWVDALASGRRSAPRVFFRLALAIVLTLLLTIVVSLVTGLVRVALRE